MKPYSAILFDLDGTLLPMDLDTFIRSYFGLLSKKLSMYPSDAMVEALWKGTKAMMANDGSVTNEARFWSVFSGCLGEEILQHKDDLEDFYRNEFHGVKAVCGENPLAGHLVRLAREKADTVVLATNPLFPPCAVEARLSWIGLSPADFDHITTYDNSSFCKPSRQYYEAICAELSLQPERCLMIGNDLKEDGLGARAAGIPVHILTDCLITHGLSLEDYPHSTLLQLLDTL